MATHTEKKPYARTPEERAAEVEALSAEITAAVQSLATSGGWRSMLEVSARFPRYSLNNQLLLWAQSVQRGVTLSRVAAFGAWKKLGYHVIAGSKSFKIFAPIRSRLRPDEVAEWLADGRNPFDAEGKPRQVLRAFRVGSVFDRSQVQAGPDAQPVPEDRAWTAQEETGPAGVWPAIVAGIRAAGFTLEHRPPTLLDGSAHGWTNYTTRTVWINSDCEEAEQIRIGAHELWGHIRCDHESRTVSRAQGETEADSVAFVVLAALGMRIDSSSAEYIAGWSNGDAEILRAAAVTVHKVATEVLAEIDNQAENEGDGRPAGRGDEHVIAGADPPTRRRSTR